jgi:transketolase C-terminal domain/subunit
MERVTQIEPHHQLGKIGSAICHAVSRADPAHRRRGVTGVTVTNRAPPSRVARSGRRPAPPLD